MKLFIDVTSSRRTMQSAGMQRMTRARRRAFNAGVIGKVCIADYNRISILSYKLL